MNKSYVWTYDNAGNILSRKEYAFTTGTLGTVQRTYSYAYGNTNWGDQLTSFDGDSITYDTIGNPLTYGDYYEFTWEGRQLTKYEYTETYYTINYQYNADGIRTVKEVIDGDMDERYLHEYTLNGSQIVKETVYSAASDDEYSESYTLVYIYDETGAPIGMKYRTPSMAVDTYTCYFFEKNLQGDIVSVYNSAGIKVIAYTYDAWGNCTASYPNGYSGITGATYNPFRYRGYYYDIETGFYYLQSRYYNPQWGRFLNADDYVSTGFWLLGYNMYAYCNNNPIIYVDISGEAPILALVLILLGAVSLYSCSGKTYEYSTGDIEGTPLDPAPKTNAYDTPEEAIADGVKYVTEQSEACFWQNEYCVTIYQYHGNGKYYIGMVDTGAGDATWSPVYIPPKYSSTMIATIHSHPVPQAEPFKDRDWDQYRYTYNRQIEMYIIDKYEGAVRIRYLPKNTYYQDEWEVYP